jgi:hypothetical protein
VRALAGALLVLAACGPLEVVVAFLPDAGGPTGPGPACVTSADCPREASCEKPGCGGLGRCQRRPGLCDAAPRPVCGCDGVSYLNDCWRRSAGALLEHAEGECQDPPPCSADRPCPGTAVCARLSLVCAPGAGACWVAPPSCPAAGAFLDCGDAAVCLDACGAIASGRPFRPAPTATCP